MFRAFSVLTCAQFKNQFLRTRQKGKLRGVYSGPPTTGRCERKLKPLLARYQRIFFSKLTNFWKNICKQVSSTQKRVYPHEIFSQVTRRILKNKTFFKNKKLNFRSSYIYLLKFVLRRDVSSLYFCLPAAPLFVLCVAFSLLSTYILLYM